MHSTQHTAHTAPHITTQHTHRATLTLLTKVTVLHTRRYPVAAASVEGEGSEEGEHAGTGLDQQRPTVRVRCVPAGLARATVV